MNIRRSITTVVVALIAIVIAQQAFAFVPWNNPNGTATYFDWFNGGSDTGLFGSPLLTNGGTSFTFFPQNFRAQSTDGASAQTSDRLQVMLVAHPGRVFGQIRIQEFGDYGILNTGQVSATGGLFLTDLNSGNTLTDTLVTNPVSPISSGQGNWTGNVAIDLTTQFPEWTSMMVVLDNNLLAISIPGSTTFIEKKVTGAVVITPEIPEPAAGLLLLIGLAALRRR